MPKKESFIAVAPTRVVADGLVGTKVKRKINRRKGELNELTRDEKMLCALRKALSSKSGLDDTPSSRYYVSGEHVYVAARSGGAQTKPGEPTSYTARGRVKIGMAHGDTCSFRIAEFNISYRDTKDERGIATIDFMDPTTIDLLPKGSSLTPS